MVIACATDEFYRDRLLIVFFCDRDFSVAIDFLRYVFVIEYVSRRDRESWNRGLPMSRHSAYVVTVPHARQCLRKVTVSLARARHGPALMTRLSWNRNRAP